MEEHGNIPMLIPPQEQLQTFPSHVDRGWHRILQTQLEKQAHSAVTAGRQGTFHSKFTQGRSGTRPGTAKASQDSGDGFGRQELQPEGITWPLQARLQTTAFTSCEAGRSRFSSCAEQTKSLLLFVYFLIKVFCATCKGSKQIGGFVELGFFHDKL